MLKVHQYYITNSARDIYLVITVSKLDLHSPGDRKFAVVDVLIFWRACDQCTCLPSVLRSCTSDRQQLLLCCSPTEKGGGLLLGIRW